MGWELGRYVANLTATAASHPMEALPLHHVENGCNKSYHILVILAWNYLIWSTREFDGAIENRSHVLGISPPTFGWSGIFVRYLFKSSLNSVTPHFVLFLKCLGRQLNNCGPCTWKDDSLKVLSLCLVDDLIFGIAHFLSAFSEIVSWVCIWC